MTQATDVVKFRQAFQPRRVATKEARTQEVVLLRQWLAATLKQYEYLSMVIVGEGGGRTLQAFQLLDLERRSMIVRPFVDADEAAQLQGLYMVSMQPLELWNPPPTVDCDSLESFVLQDPQKVDILTAIGGVASGRGDLYAWEPMESDIDGCMTLAHKTRLTDRHLDLMSASAPVLSLLDALHAKGFTGVGAVVVHDEGTRQYDSRRLPGRRTYLQCALHFDRLKAKGVDSFRSVGPAAYFTALLHAKVYVRPGLTGSEYKALMQREQGSVGEDAPLEDLVDAQVARRNRAMSLTQAAAPRALQPPAIRDDDDGDSVAGGGSPVSAPGAEGNPAAHEDHGVASDSGSSVAGGGADDALVVVAGAATVARLAVADGMPEKIMGMKVSIVKGRISQSHSYADRLTVQCSNPHHARCSKSRSVALLRDELGVRCAEAFLACWLAKADSMERGGHAKYAPSLGEQRAYLAAHPLE